MLVGKRVRSSAETLIIKVQKSSNIFKPCIHHRPLYRDKYLKNAAFVVLYGLY